MPATPEPTTALAVEILDALMVVAPRGFRAVDLALERNASGGLRVRELTSHLAGEKPLEKPALGVETGAFHGVINEALSDLAAILASRGVQGDAVRARIERSGDSSATIAMSFANDAAPAFSEVLDDAALQQRVFTETLFNTLLVAEPEMTKRQAALGETLNGHDDWAYDESTQTLKLTRGVLPWATLRAVPIGSYAYESETWLWAWANRALPSTARETSAEVRETVRNTPGLGVLVRHSLPCAEAFALRLAGVAALRMNARGVYGASYGPGVLILAVMP